MQDLGIYLLGEYVNILSGDTRVEEKINSPVQFTKLLTKTFFSVTDPSYTLAGS